MRNLCTPTYPARPPRKDPEPPPAAWALRGPNVAQSGLEATTHDRRRASGQKWPICGRSAGLPSVRGHAVVLRCECEFIGVGAFVGVRGTGSGTRSGGAWCCSGSASGHRRGGGELVGEHAAIAENLRVSPSRSTTPPSRCRRWSRRLPIFRLGHAEPGAEIGVGLCRCRSNRGRGGRSPARSMGRGGGSSASATSSRSDVVRDRPAHQAGGNSRSPWRDTGSTLLPPDSSR